MTGLQAIQENWRVNDESPYEWPELAEVIERAEETAAERLAEAVAGYLLWAPRQAGHAAAHRRLWAAYREYEASLASSERST